MHNTIQTAFENFYKYCGFLGELIKKDFKKKYYKSTLGVLWTILNPLLMMLVITVVFSTLFKRNIDNFPVYYLIGSLFLSFYNGATSQSLHSITGNFGLIRKIYLPKYMFPMATVVQNLITFGFSLIPLLGLMLLTNVPFTPYMFVYPLIVVLLVIFITGVSLILSSLSVIFRDLSHLYGIFTMVLMYITPVFYPIGIIPKRFLFAWELNPLYIYITLARNVLLDGVMPTEKLLLSATAYSLLTIITGFIVFNQKQDTFMLHI